MFRLQYAVSIQKISTLWIPQAVDHCGPLWTTAGCAGQCSAKLSVGQTDGHLQRYHQWLFEGGEVLLNSGALKVLVDEHMHAHHGFNKCYQPCPCIHACFFADTVDMSVANNSRNMEWI